MNSMSGSSTVALSRLTSPGRTEAKPSPWPRRRMCGGWQIFAVALRLQHRVDGAADLPHRDARAGRPRCRRSSPAPPARICARALGRLAEHHGAADLRELAAIARRDLGQDDVALLRACGRSRAGPRGCADRRTAAGNCPRRRASSCSHLSSTASSSSLMPGRAICKQPRVAELGDARRLAGEADLLDGLGAGGVEHDLSADARLRQRRADAGAPCRKAAPPARRCRPDHGRPAGNRRRT